MQPFCVFFYYHEAGLLANLTKDFGSTLKDFEIMFVFRIASNLTKMQPILQAKFCILVEMLATHLSLSL